MQSTGDYYQRAPRCCPGRNANANADALRINASVRGAELLCCCCSCSTATSTKTPGLLASLGVCVLVLGYTLLGAFAFMALEGGLKSVGHRFFGNIILSKSSLEVWYRNCINVLILNKVFMLSKVIRNEKNGKEENC